MKLIAVTVCQRLGHKVAALLENRGAPIVGGYCGPTETTIVFDPGERLRMTPRLAQELVWGRWPDISCRVREVDEATFQLIEQGAA